MIKYVFFFYKKIVLKEVSFTSTNTIYYRPIKTLSSFFITRKEISMKKLDQIRSESKEIKDKIDDTEERLRQVKINKRRY